MSKNTAAILLLFLLAGIWGSSFILMKLAMYTSDGSTIFNDTQVASLRMLIASLVLIPVSIVSIRKIKQKKDFLFLGAVGVFGNFIPAFLFTYAETSLSSGYAGMLNSFTPVFALLIGSFFFKQRMTLIQVTGIGIAFGGIVLLMKAGNSLTGGASFPHVLAVIAATCCYGISLNVIKHRLGHLSSMQITSLSFGLLLVPGLIACFLFKTPAVFEQSEHAWKGLGYILTLSIVGTAIALVIFNRVIAISSTLFASSVTYLIPIVAVILGTLYGEELNLLQVISMLVVLIGVFVANYLQKLVAKYQKRSA
ncbi:MAG: DMT family transporter [Bacteroidetes bacterium]|nr:MAG: DMT family transporter [Bacteroidota bacterium]